MDLIILKQDLKNRLELSNKYASLIGRHLIFNKYKQNLEDGIEIIKYQNRFITAAGNIIHQAETQLYSMALDVFQSYGFE